MRKKINLGTAIAIILLAIALTFTLTYSEVSRELNRQLTDTSQLISKLSKYIEAEGYIESSFIGDYDEETIMDGAISGMVESLDDQWSYYMTAEEYESYLERSNNEYVGIGTVISKDEETGGLLVEKVYPDSPASEAGITAGDIITEIDGQSVFDADASDAKEMVSGEEGTAVEITVIKADGGEVTLTLTRRAVTIDAVTYVITDDNIGIVTIENFDANVSDDFTSAVNYLTGQGVGGLVFDVRFNPGGKLDELLPMLDLLLPEGTTFISRDKEGNEKIYTSDAGCLDLPMAVLVNADSYSAAEFFAAALQEYGRADVVGVNTTGKGYSQQAIELSDGSAIVLSTGEYFTPNGVSLAGVGITPDYIVEISDEELAKLYSGSLAAEDDAQLQKALEVVRGEIAS